MEARLQTDLPQITKRQLEVARLVARGLDNPTIASELGISLAGAKYHVSELLARLNLTTRDEIATWYHARDNRGLIHRFAFAPVGIAATATAGAVAVGAAVVAISFGAAGSGTDAIVIPEVAATEAPAVAALPAPEGDFLPVTAPNSPVRLRYSATTLDDGRVLLAGGTDSGAGAAAELYDLATGSFAPTGTPLQQRYDHSAALLAGGEVLLIGGLSRATGGTAVLDSTELWSPVTGEFVATASMTEPRMAHAVVTLFDGRVLVSGGVPALSEDGSPVDPVATAELYDPATDEFTSTGSMNIARRDHQLTLLVDGRALVSGSGALELYDPVTGEFTLFGGEPVFGSRPTVSTLLFDGRILITGVYTDPADSEFGFSENARGAYIVDPASGAVVPVGPMRTGRDYYHTATLLDDGRVLLTGGAGGWAPTQQDPTLYPPAEIFDPVDGSFEPIAFADATSVPGDLRATNLATHSAGHTANLLPDGSVLLVGYRSVPTLRWSVERFDPLAAGGEDPFGDFVAAYVPEPVPTPGALLSANSTLFYGSSGEPYSFDALFEEATATGLQLRDLPSGFGGCSGGQGRLGASRLRAEQPDGSAAYDFMFWVYPTIELLEVDWETDETGRVDTRPGSHCNDALFRGQLMETGGEAFVNGNLVLLLGMPDPDFNERNPETRALLIEAFEAIGTSEE